jgi:Uma2 family endonuclease
MPVSFAVDEYPVVLVPDRATTSIDSFREWAGDPDLPERIKLFYYRGEVWIEMGKQQLFSHLEVKSAIISVLYTLAKTRQLGYVFPDGVLITNAEADLSGNPDGTFVSYGAMQSGQVKLIEGVDGAFVELIGSPNMVLEVVSDSSEKKDRQTLLEAYFEAGIAEYWLVDARGEDVEFTIFKRSPKKYIASRALPGDWLKSASFGQSFRLVRGTSALGHPTFTLEVK